MGSIMGRIDLYFACWFVLKIFEERNGINHKKNWSIFWFVLNIFGKRMGSIMGRIGLYFACWVVLNIFGERNGINHEKNRSIFCVLGCVEHI